MEIDKEPYMKQKLIPVLALLAALAVSIAPLGADTVMVYTEETGGKGDVKMSRGFLEDGVMSAFFEAGHIVFNAFPEMAEGKEEPEDFAERFSVRVAKSGGANLLLEIGMKFNDDEEEPIPRSASYRFYELESGNLLAEGRVALSEVGDREKLDNEEMVKRLGEAVAVGALGKF
jgi:hypothetical protein